MSAEVFPCVQYPGVRGGWVGDDVNYFFYTLLHDDGWHHHSLAQSPSPLAGVVSRNRCDRFPEQLALEGIYVDDHIGVGVMTKHQQRSPG